MAIGGSKAIGRIGALRSLLIRANINDRLKQFFARSVPPGEAYLAEHVADDGHRDRTAVFILEDFVELFVQVGTFESVDFDGQPIQFARRFKVSRVVGKLDRLISAPIGGTRAIDQCTNVDVQCFPPWQPVGRAGIA